MIDAMRLAPAASSTTRWRAAAIVAVAVGLAAAPVGAGRATSPPKWLLSARAQLARLSVRPAGSMVGYTRSAFGEPWDDVDGNGCDTRDDVFRRDLKSVVFKTGSTCVVARGTLHDPYTGTTITFVRGVGTSTAVQIDHVVALADAWRTGAAAWTPAPTRLRQHSPSAARSRRAGERGEGRRRRRRVAAAPRRLPLPIGPDAGRSRITRSSVSAVSGTLSEKQE